jgi:predicted AAA+ superfamily ATPase
MISIFGFMQNIVSELLRDKHLPPIQPPEIRRVNQDRIVLRREFATILTGIRRSGKSTLLCQLMRDFPDAFYCNFENTRLYGMSEQDFPPFLDELNRLVPQTAPVFFDEVQEVSGWQRLVRALLDGGRMVCLTGSNASLLGVELGTKLTGRHLSHHIYPFCYSEYLAYTGKTRGKDSLLTFLNEGGFPSFLRERDESILWGMLRDTVQRDVVLRHNLRETRNVMNIALFLLANTGQPFSFQTLGKNLGIPGASQVAAYLEYLQDAYLLVQIPKFSQSFKQRVVAPGKYYAIDNGLRHASPQATPDIGRRLENAVALDLVRRRRHDQNKVFYASEKDVWECDFLAEDTAIQVSLEINENNFRREANGLLEAVKIARASKFFILTLDTRDSILFNGVKIDVLPAWEWLA